MSQFSLSQLAEITGKDRRTVAKMLAGVPFTEGGRDHAHLYESATALEFIYRTNIGAPGEKITNAEAQLQLTIARKAEIDLNMEVLRKERPRIEDVRATVEEAFRNVAGIVKASKLPQESKADIFTQLRDSLKKLETDDALAV